MKKFTFLLTCFLLLGLSSSANAELITIGTATYTSAPYYEFNTSQSNTENIYNLIWDKDNNGKSLVWLDYTNEWVSWGRQMNWAADLDSFLTINIDPGYNLTWNDDAWRLPTAGVHPQTFYSVTTAEMGHLYTEELGLASLPNQGGQDVTEIELNASNFNNLIPGTYWTGVGNLYDLDNAWVYYTDSGIHYEGNLGGNYGIAVRGAYITPVPEPATMFLFALGLLGLAGVSRKKHGN